LRPTIKEFRNFFNASSRFVIPVYQRAYSWDKERWSNLWRDLAYMYVDSLTAPTTVHAADHFMGTLIVEPEGTFGTGDVAIFRVVDGQQRLATIYVLLAAIRDYDNHLTGKTIRDVNALSHILDPDEPDAPNPPERFVVQKGDQDVLRAIASGKASLRGAAHHGHALYRAYEFFLYQLWRGHSSLEEALLSADPSEQFLPPRQPRNGFEEPSVYGFWTNQIDKPTSDPIDLTELRGIVTQRLQVLELLLESGDEDAALIFESVNSKTQSLHQFDHIKNSVFVRLPTKRDTVFETDWDPVVSQLKTVSYAGKRSDAGDQFVYDYLIARGESKRQGAINKGRAYTQFMSRLDSCVVGPTTRPGYESAFLEFVRSDFLRAAAVWPAAVGQATEIRLAGRTLVIPDACVATVKTIMELSAGPPVPLVLHLLEGFATGKLPNRELEKALKYIESFVARHGIYGTPLSPFRAQFMQVMANLSGSFSIDALKVELLEKGWPDDDALIEKALEVDMYDRLQSRQVNAILRGLEERLAGSGAHHMVFGKGEGEYSVEHVFPKSEPNAAWLRELTSWGIKGAKLQQLVARRHRLGNLTAVSGKDNKRLGTKPFSKKRHALENAVAPLRLHDGIVGCDRWTAKEIDQRGEMLAKVAIERWPRPSA
jgi:hypothetical protein